ncbi:MAG: beta-galactosidase, partial [Mucilaginibacter sp.]
FVKTAREEGLFVILRPSPYVCAEWEFGGYPYWLQNEKGLEVRSKESQYLKEYETYIKEVGKQLAPLQVNHGGNILMVQIENEYGSYGSDKEYLAINQKMFKDAGFDGLLYTCDPPDDISKGYLPGLLPAVNALDNPEKVKKIVRQLHNGKGPFYIAEWYPAWFDWWGTAHHTVPAEKYTGRLDSVLSAGISINMYMFHGGTTRGFMNGANFKDNTSYEPQISSYDYDAPLDEAGNATAKYIAFRKVIEKHLPPGQTLPDVPASKPAIAIKSIRLTNSADLLNNLQAPKANTKPLSFEDLNQAYGYVLYRTEIKGGTKGALKIGGLRDYAVVMINGKTVGTLDRRLNQDSLLLDLPTGKVKLDVLVENMGRINFGKYLLQNKKGITGKVLFKGDEVINWKMFKFPFDDINTIKYTGSNLVLQNHPVIKSGVFQLNKTGDTYLDMRNWEKGIVWINGHNLGRYWSIGPQQTLYVPVEWLKKGKNKIVVLELIKPGKYLSSLDKPILNELRKLR